ncbi:MAG: helix-turn-helix domain-containing protein [Bacteroidia bacterium]
MKAFYTVKEVAAQLGVPPYQVRRWLHRYFHAHPPHKHKKIPSTWLAQLRRIYEGAYLYRLRGKKLEAFLKNAPPSAESKWVLFKPWLEEFRQALQALENFLEENRPEKIV